MVNVLRTSGLSTKPTPRTKEQTLSKGTNWCAENGVCVYRWFSGICECVTVCDEPDIILAESGRICQSNLSTARAGNSGSSVGSFDKACTTYQGSERRLYRGSNDSLLN